MMQRREHIWHELYAYESEIYGYIKNAVGDGNVARDLYQDVFFTAVQNLDQLDENRSLKNWLFTVTRNRVINYYKFHKRREYDDLSDAMLETAINENSGMELIQATLDQLTERQREILVLREIEGWNYEEIAAQLGLSMSAVTSLLKRARESFQKNYITHFLPNWFARAAGNIALDDLLRFINPFNPPVNLVEQINRRCNEYYSQIRSGWNQVRDSFITASDLDEILVALDLPWKAVVGDFGSGQGFVSNAVASRAGQIVALDTAPAMNRILKASSAKLKPAHISVVQADIHMPPVRPRSLDAVFLALVLHHLPDPLKVVESAAALLRSGGYLVIVDFYRHDDRELADSMHDLWLGFDPYTFRKRCRALQLETVVEGEFRADKRLATFYQVFKRR